MPAATEGNNPGTGLAIVHGNRLEVLRELLVHWLHRHPPAVLENETLLVQSNGIAQWLRLALANPPDAADQPGYGIAAALDIQLPSAFLCRLSGPCWVPTRCRASPPTTRSCSPGG